MRYVFIAGKGNTNCPCCGSTAVYTTDFKDDLSRREYMISGLCQPCQDSVFEEEEADQDWSEEAR